MKKIYAFALAALLAPTVAMADATDAAYFDNYAAFQGTSSHGNTRGCNTMTVSTSGGESITVNGTGTTNHQIYKDYTAEAKLIVKPGEIISVTGTSGNTLWMHNFVYVDYGRDGRFDLDLESTSVNGDLVAFSGYTLAMKPDNTDTADPTKNSDGKSIDNNNYWNDTPDFILPENLQPGEYRMRVKNDWNSTHPYGRTNETVVGNQKQNNNINSNGGFIMDITLVVEGEEPEEYTVTYTTEGDGNVLIYDAFMTEYENGSTFPAGTELQLVAKGLNGSVIKSFVVNGTSVDAAVGKEFSYYEVVVDENVVISASFEAPAPANAVITVNVGEGGKLKTLMNAITAEFLIQSGEMLVNKTFEVEVGQKLGYFIEANEGYVIDEFTFGGVAVEGAAGKTSQGGTLDVTGDAEFNVTFISTSSLVEGIEAAEAAAPVYYNLQGVRVANPADGVYIRVAGDKAEKVYLSK